MLKISVPGSAIARFVGFKNSNKVFAHEWSCRIGHNKTVQTHSVSVCRFVCYCFKSTPIDTHTNFFLCYCASSQQFTFWKLLIHEKIKSSKAPWRFDEGGTHNAVVFDEQLLRCRAGEINL